eukprot:GHVU01046199.1.p1 GENE.GHVU01046199.1~~GHVU01046199.1.p1  ORF type:complete len:316 (+),score=27.65 GHVU01046199.1:96-1043(+)
MKAFISGIHDARYIIPAGQDLGCWTDASDGKRVMQLQIGNIGNDHNRCIDKCHYLGFPYAAMQAKVHCFCGTSYKTLGPSYRCTNKCEDDFAMCGGAWANSVYTAYQFEHLGCWKDTSDRALSGLMVVLGSESVYNCIDKCTEAGFLFAGMQNLNECFCGNKYDKHGKADSDTECAGRCYDGTHCGVLWRMNVYKTALTKPDRHFETRQSMGCWKDAADRAMTGGQFTMLGKSHEECVRICERKGYKYAGVQNGNECFCGQEYCKCIEGGNGRQMGMCGDRGLEKWVGRCNCSRWICLWPLDTLGFLIFFAMQLD